MFPDLEEVLVGRDGDILNVLDNLQKNRLLKMAKHSHVLQHKLELLRHNLLAATVRRLLQIFQRQRQLRPNPAAALRGRLLAQQPLSELGQGAPLAALAAAYITSRRFYPLHHFLAQEGDAVALAEPRSFRRHNKLLGGCDPALDLVGQLLVDIAAQLDDEEEDKQEENDEGGREDLGYGLFFEEGENDVQVEVERVLQTDGMQLQRLNGFCDEGVHCVCGLSESNAKLGKETICR